MHSDSTFLSNLRYWSLHVCLNAAPSFLFVLTPFQPRQDAVISGMLAGIALFILGYTLLTSSRWFQTTFAGGLFERALKWATRIRSAIAAAGIIGVVAIRFGLHALSPLFTPDLWAGFFATRMVESFGRLGPVRDLRISLTGNDAAVRAKSWWIGDMNSAVPAFLTTVTEGAILSLCLFTLAVVLYLAARCWRWRARKPATPPDSSARA